LEDLEQLNESLSAEEALRRFSFSSRRLSERQVDDPLACYGQVEVEFTPRTKFNDSAEKTDESSPENDVFRLSDANRNLLKQLMSKL